MQIGASGVFGFEAARKYAVRTSLSNRTTETACSPLQADEEGLELNARHHVGVEAPTPAVLRSRPSPGSLVAAIFGLGETGSSTRCAEPGVREQRCRPAGASLPACSDEDSAARPWTTWQGEPRGSGGVASPAAAGSSPRLYCGTILDRCSATGGRETG